jgi:hypothetical protein
MLSFSPSPPTRLLTPPHPRVAQRIHLAQSKPRGTFAHFSGRSDARRMHIIGCGKKPPASTPARQTPAIWHRLLRRTEIVNEGYWQELSLLPTFPPNFVY